MFSNQNVLLDTSLNFLCFRRGTTVFYTSHARAVPLLFVSHGQGGTLSGGDAGLRRHKISGAATCNFLAAKSMHLLIRPLLDTRTQISFDLPKSSLKRWV